MMRALIPFCFKVFPFRRAWALLFLVGVSSCFGGLWVTGYFPGWEQASIPASDIEFSVLTHVIHFSAIPNKDGTLNTRANSLSESNSADVVSQAHAAGRSVLLCIGAGGTRSMFLNATTPNNLPNFISNITSLVSTRGYDGVDIDWEPLFIADFQQFTNLIRNLRTALDKMPGHKLLTTAVAAYPPYGDPLLAQYTMVAGLQSQLDQVNIMSYDLAGPYSGWVTWFNSALYDGGHVFPKTSRLLPSVDGAVRNFLTQGVALEKLGIGIPFYGYLWTGGSGSAPLTHPRLGWTTAPTATPIRYSTICTQYYEPSKYHWETNAQAAYLSITNANPTNSLFISYDDEQSCHMKVSYAINRRLGGVAIWQLAQDHQKGQKSPLLAAIQQALSRPEPNYLQIMQPISLNFRSFTNQHPRTSILLFPDVIDSSRMTNQMDRFYKIQTSP